MRNREIENCCRFLAIDKITTVVTWKQNNVCQIGYFQRSFELLSGKGYLLKASTWSCLHRASYLVNSWVKMWTETRHNGRSDMMSMIIRSS